MAEEIGKNRDIVVAAGASIFGDGFAAKNDGVGGAHPRGYDLNPTADPAHVEAALREIAKRLEPGEWQAICEAAGVPKDLLLPRDDNEDEHGDL